MFLLEFVWFGSRCEIDLFKSLRIFSNQRNVSHGNTQHFEMSPSNKFQCQITISCVFWRILKIFIRRTYSGCGEMLNFTLLHEVFHQNSCMFYIWRSDNGKKWEKQNILWFFYIWCEWKHVQHFITRMECFFCVWQSSLRFASYFYVQFWYFKLCVPTKLTWLQFYIFMMII